MNAKSRVSTRHAQCHLAGRTYLHIDLVSAQYNRDILADALEVAVPVRDVLVRDARRDIEHNDAALALNIISVSQPTKLLLPGSVPHVEADRAEISGKREWVHLHTERGCSVVRTESVRRHIANGKYQARIAPMYFFSNSPVK